MGYQREAARWQEEERLRRIQTDSIRRQEEWIRQQEQEAVRREEAERAQDPLADEIRQWHERRRQRAEEETRCRQEALEGHSSQRRQRARRDREEDGSTTAR